MSQGNSLDKASLHLYLTDSIGVVLNALSRRLTVYQALHFQIFKAEQFPLFVNGQIVKLMKQSATLLFPF